MTVIIAGSRSVQDYSVLLYAVELSRFWITEVVSGCAPGPDTLGRQWSQEHLGTDATLFPAEWRPNGVFDRAAGYKRNQRMVDYVRDRDGGLLAVYDGFSNGTADCIERADKAKLKVYVHDLSKPTIRSLWA